MLVGLGAVLILILAVFSFQGEKAVDSNTTVVLYNSVKIGVIEKTIEVELEEGINSVSLDGLAGLDIAEVTIMSLDDGARVLGIFSRGSTGDVYSANVGSEVEVKLRSGDTVTGKFLGIKDGKLAIQGDAYYIINPDEVVYFKAKNLEGASSVYASIQADNAGKYSFDVIYRIFNMSWSSRYKLYIEDTAKLYGHILIDNPTAQTFEGAKVLLVAGDVQLYQKAFPQPGVIYAKAEEEAVELSEPPKIEAFYLYKLGIVDLNPSSKMAFPYISFEVPFELEYLYESYPYGDGEVYESVSFKTEQVLPAGIVEIYRGTEDRTLLIGERWIEHTPKDETLRIGIGRNYDLKGSTVILEEEHGDGYAYYKVKVTVENFGEETKTVIVSHYKWGKLLSSSIDPINETANYVEFKITLKPGEKKEMVFDYESRW